MHGSCHDVEILHVLGVKKIACEEQVDREDKKTEVSTLREQAKEELFRQVNGHRHASPLFCKKSQPTRLNHHGSTSQTDSHCSPPTPSAPTSTAPSPD